MCTRKQWQLPFDGFATLRITAVWRDVSDVEVELGLGGVGQDFDELLDQQEVEFRYQDIESLEVLLSGKVNLLSLANAN